MNLNTYDSRTDAFLVKFDGSGNRLWSTYYGGNKRDYGYAVVADHVGSVYLAGSTESGSDIAHNGYDNTFNEDGIDGNRFRSDAFLVKFNKDGIRQWATYYGGENGRAEFAHGAQVDSWNNVYLTGYTNSTTGIAFNGHDSTLGRDSEDDDNDNDEFDAFLVKFNPSGDLLWGTYFGRQGFDRANAITTDPWDNVYITGQTESAFMGSSGHDMLYDGKKDAFLAKFTNTGTLLWSTYYGGEEYDEGFSVATDAAGSVYLAGSTKSNNDISHNGHDNTFNGVWDAFLVKFNFLGTRLWATYYGGNSSDFSARVAVSKNDDVYLAGHTYSETGIATNNGYDLSLNSNIDTYLVRFNIAGERQWGTYFGGNSRDYVSGITTDISANVYITGRTYSKLELAKDGFQSQLGGDFDALLAKFKPYGNRRPGGPSGPGGYDSEDDDPNHDDPPTKGGVTTKSGIGSQYEHEASSRISIYPNPATDLVNIRLPQLSEAKGTLEIYGPDGRKVLVQSLGKASVQSVNVSGWKKGIYVAKLVGPNQELFEKFIVK